MALFGNLFKKKQCAICGGEIGLLGNRKLEDGNMCKNCAGKLSRWFDDRRHSTVEQINRQLEYRAQNQRELETFKASRSYGNDDRIMVEERDGVPYRFIVSESSDWKNDNPDIILFKDVLSCTLDVDRFDRELKYTNGEGEEVSYVPPRYEYDYNFYVEMQIANNPYFDDIRVKLNPSSVEIVSEELGRGRFGSRRQDHTYHPQYRIYQQMFEDIEAVFTKAKESASAAAAAPRPKLCPGCGAPAGEDKFCPYCGTRLG